MWKIFNCKLSAYILDRKVTMTPIVIRDTNQQFQIKKSNAFSNNSIFIALIAYIVWIAGNLLDFKKTCDKISNVKLLEHLKSFDTSGNLVWLIEFLNQKTSKCGLMALFPQIVT